MTHSSSLPLLLAAMLVPAPAALAEQPQWPDAGGNCYLHDDSTGYRLSRWMGWLPDSTSLGALSMVGTHDSGSRFGGDAVATQTLSIRAQLDMGVRMLDLRFKRVGRGLEVYHGIIAQKLGAREAMGQVVDFLKANPSETVLVRVKDEDTSVKGPLSFEEAFVEQVAKPFRASNPKVFWDERRLPVLGEARGRILILQDFSANDSYGPRYGLADAQDAYTVKTNWDLYDKWLKVKAHLEKADNAGPGKALFLNYLSASGGSFPYFIASGKSSPGTGAPRLATGLTTPGFKDRYPDFPRVSCFIGICTIAFEGTNILASQRIEAMEREHREAAERRKAKPAPVHVGVLMADFPGPRLVAAVTRLNFPQR